MPKDQARRQRDTVSHRDMQLTASQAAPVARAAQGSPLTAPPPPLPSMPRLPPLRSKVWLRQAMAIVAPPPRVIAEARRSSALEELQQLRREEAQADEDAAAPSGGPYPFSSHHVLLGMYSRLVEGCACCEGAAAATRVSRSPSLAL